MKPTRRTLLRWGVSAMMIAPANAHAKDAMMPFSLSDQSRWEYLSDQVMGGVSQGQVRFEPGDGGPVLRLTGRVSTDNRGGFIQARTTLDAPLPDRATGVVLTVRGNDQPYFIHLRTSWTALPWQFYQASFMATQTWAEVRLPFADFAPKGGLLRQNLNVPAIRSLAIAAYGRDHMADLSVRAVGVY